MKFTGERFVPDVRGVIELEHMHRYLLAKEVVHQKTVLDIASGEGYGSHMLAKNASKVFGVDISIEAINHSKAKYQADNLEYLLGSCSAIPLADHSVDIVISFETIEHHDEHIKMMQEIKRVLKPDGSLIISSPDKLEYSDIPVFNNEHHVKELYRNEFEELINKFFKYKRILGQRMTYGSAIVAEDSRVGILTYQLDEQLHTPFAGIRRAVYLIAIASDQAIPDLASGLLEQDIERSEVVAFWKHTVEQLQSHVGRLKQDILEDQSRIANYIQAVEGRDGVIIDLTTKLTLSNSGYDIGLKRTADCVRTDDQETFFGQISNRVTVVNDKTPLNGKPAIGPDTEPAKNAGFEKGISEEIAKLRGEIAMLRNSSSWRITAPLRFISSTVKRMFSPQPFNLPGFEMYGGFVATAKKAVKIYRREGLTGVVRGFRKLQRSMRTVNASNLKDRNLKLGTTSVGRDLKVADGIWEWTAYCEVKSRILKTKAELLFNVTVLPVPIFKIKETDLLSLASQINLVVPLPQPKISIILPVFNNIKLTVECLMSIANSDRSVNYEVIVADDCSSDTTEIVLKNVKHIKYLRNSKNEGFLRNTNIALSNVRGEFVLYLNNDVQVSGPWLSLLLKTFADYPLAGAVGPKFVYPNGRLQEAGATFNFDGTAEMIGLNETPKQERFTLTRRVDYVSGACLMAPSALIKRLGGFSEEFLPCYCEDGDLCLQIQSRGYYVYCNSAVTVMHHLSKTTDKLGDTFKLKCVYKNVTTLREKWQNYLQKIVQPRVIAFYLPQFHPFPENNQWWGPGFTEWTNVVKARPNFVGHYQPRYPADLGYYDLRLPEILVQQAALAQRYGVGGFCFYYYWFNGNRLLEQPLEQMLKSKDPDFPFCLCWANENWTRRWDGLDHEVLMAQAHSTADDTAVIEDLMRYFRDSRYIRIDGRPLLLVYRVALFPDFAATAALWRELCRVAGIGEIYLSSVESFDDVNGNRDPASFGCDATVEFPPHGMGEAIPLPGSVLNPDFTGVVANYDDVAVRFATRPAPAYTRFRSVMPGWDNTARRQDTGYCFDNSTPGAFQAWLEESLEQTHLDRFGDEKLVFLNAWNEWAEGAYIEPDKRFGHAYLEAVRNALDAKQLKR